MIFVLWHLNFVLRWAYLQWIQFLCSLFVRENLWLSGLCDYLKTLFKPKVGATEIKITMLYIHYAILWFQICVCLFPWTGRNWDVHRHLILWFCCCNWVFLLFIYAFCLYSSPGFPKGSSNLYLNKPWSSDPLSFSCRLISKKKFRSVSSTIPSTSS